MALLERRQYDLRPGAAETFWQAQRDWNRTELALEVARRNLGYFRTIGAGSEQIVHLYSWPSLAIWQKSYAALYTQHPEAYFATVRTLFSAQGNAFFSPAPVGAFNPQPTGDAALPAAAIHSQGLDPGRLCITEACSQLVPGGLGAYWEAARHFATESPALAAAQLLGTYGSSIGALHQVLQYRWFRSADAARDYDAACRGDAGWRRFSDETRELVRTNRLALLEPSPVPWLRAQLDPPEWEAVRTK